MGGLMIVVPVLLISLLLNVVSVVRGNTTGRSVLLPLAVLTTATVGTSLPRGRCSGPAADHLRRTPGW
jgi:hypothetical protein